MDFFNTAVLRKRPYHLLHSYRDAYSMLGNYCGTCAVTLTRDPDVRTVASRSTAAM